MKHKIRVVLKSGYSFAFLCDNMEVRSTENVLIGYSIEGLGKPQPMFIRMDHVDAVINEGKAEDEADNGQ